VLLSSVGVTSALLFGRQCSGKGVSVPQIFQNKSGYHSASCVMVIDGLFFSQVKAAGS
jgi:hypothetical protein